MANRTEELRKRYSRVASGKDETYAKSRETGSRTKADKLRERYADSEYNSLYNEYNRRPTTYDSSALRFLSIYGNDRRNARKQELANQTRFMDAQRRAVTNGIDNGNNPLGLKNLENPLDNMRRMEKYKEVYGNTHKLSFNDAQKMEKAYGGADRKQLEQLKEHYETAKDRDYSGELEWVNDKLLSTATGEQNERRQAVLNKKIKDTDNRLARLYDIYAKKNLENQINNDDIFNDPTIKNNPLQSEEYQAKKEALENEKKAYQNELDAYEQNIDYRTSNDFEKYKEKGKKDTNNQVEFYRNNSDENIDAFWNNYDNTLSKTDNRTGITYTGTPIYERSDLDFVRAITEEEADNYAYILGKYGEEKAHDYLQSIAKHTDVNGAITNMQKAAEQGKKNPLLATAESIGLGLVTPFEAAKNITGFGGQYRTYDDYALAGRQEALRSGVNEAIQNTNLPGSENVLPFLYNTANSTADNLLRYAVGGGVGAASGSAGAAKGAMRVMMAGQVGDSAMKSALDRGLTDSQAVTTAIISAINEELFETISLERLDAMKAASPKQFRDIAKNVGKQILAEGSEEVFTDIGNAIADDLVNGEKSEIAQNIKNYMSQGLSEEEAKKKASVDFALQLVESGLAGGLSGATMGGVETVRQINTLNNQNMYDDIAQSYINAGMSEEDAYDAADNDVRAGLENKYDNEGNVVEQTGLKKSLRNAVKSAAELNENIQNLETQMKAGVEPTTPISDADIRDNKENIRLSKADNEYLNEVGKLLDYDLSTKEGALKFIEAQDKLVEKYPERRQQITKTTSSVATQGQDKATALNDLRNELTNTMPTNETSLESQINASQGNTANRQNIEVPQKAEFKATIDGEEKTIKAVNNGKIIVQDNNGREQAVDIREADLTDGASAAVEQAKRYGARGSRLYLDNLESGNIRNYTLAFNTFYNAGKNGKTFYGNKTLGVDTSLLIEAYAAGVADNSKKSEVGGLIRNEARYKIKEAEARVLDTMGKKFGVTIQIDNMLSNDANGLYQDGIIHISANAENPALVVFSHEFTHRLEETSPEAYKEYENFVIDYLKEQGLYDYRAESLKNLYARAGVKLSEKDIRSEIAANATESFLTDADLIESVVNEKKSLVPKIIDTLKSMINDLKDALSGYRNPKSTEAQAIRNGIGTFEKALELWINAAENQTETNNSQQQFSLKESSDKELENRYDELVKQYEEYKDNEDYEEELGDLEYDLRDIVEEYAKKKGFDTLVYHGTQDFGFTKIDTNMSDDKLSFFATDSLEIANSYSDAISEDSYVRKVSDKSSNLGNYEFYANTNNFYEVDAHGQNWNQLRINDNESLLEDINELHNLMKNMDPNIKLEEVYENLDGIADAVENYLNEYAYEAEESFTQVELNRLEQLSKRIDKLVNEWNKTEHYDENGEEQTLYWYLKENKPNYMNTRQIAEMAKNQGYDGVLYKNVHDDGGQSYESAPLGNVYNFFNPQQQVKSADAVTYDDEGNVIPLSERFNEANPDIRFSLKESNDFYKETGFDVRTLTDPTPENIIWYASRNERAINKYLEDRKVNIEPVIIDKKIDNLILNEDIIKNYIKDNDLDIVSLVTDTDVRDKFYNFVENEYINKADKPFIRKRYQKYLNAIKAAVNNDDYIDGYWRYDFDKLDKDINSIKNPTQEKDKYATKNKKQDYVEEHYNDFEKYLGDKIEKIFGWSLNGEKEKASDEDKERHVEDAINRFGTLSEENRNWNKGAYITLTGDVLNFGGKGSDTRDHDHRDISAVYDEDESTKYRLFNPTDYLNQFLSEGNVRIMPESSSIDMNSNEEPNSKQYATIRDYIDDYAAETGKCIIEFSDDDGRSVDSKYYENNINSSQIINDIKRFYREGKIGGSNLNQFRYSLKEDSEGNKLTPQQQEFFKDSKVVDEDGNLLVVYHGSPKKFTEFNLDAKGVINGRVLGDGFYFTNYKKRADYYGKRGKVFKVYLNIKNPLYFTETTKTPDEIKKILDESNERKYEEYKKDESWWGNKKNISKDKYIKDNKNNYSYLRDAIYELQFLYGSDENVASTDDVTRILKDLGYDGIIFDSKKKNEKEIVAFYPNQIKNVDNENPTDNPDIRFSLKEESNINRNDVAALTGNNEYMAEAVNDLEETLNNRYGDLLFDVKNYELYDVFDEICKQYNIKGYSKQKFARNVKELFDYIKNVDHPDGVDTTMLAMQVAADMLDKGSVLDTTMLEMYPTLPEELRNKKIKISQQDRADLDGGYARFRRKYFGNLTLTDEGTEVDTVYEGLSAQYPELFPSDITHPADRLTQIGNVVDLFKRTLDHIQGASKEESAFIIAQDIINKAVLERTKHEDSIAKNKRLDIQAKVREQVANLKKAEKEIYYENIRLRRRIKSLESLNNNANNKIAKKEKEWEDYKSGKKQVKGQEKFYRKQYYEKLKEEFVLGEVTRSKAKNRAERQATIDMIKNLTNKLSRTVLRPSKNNYVPTYLLNSMIDVLQMIDLDSGYRNPDGSPTKVYLHLQNLKKQYEALRTDAKYNASGEDEQIKQVAEVIDRIAETVKDKRVNQLTNYELENLLALMKIIHYQINRSQELFKNQNYKRVADLSEKARENIKKAGREFDPNAKVKNIANKYLNNTLSPVRLFKRLEGYAKDGALTTIAEELQNGERESKLIKQTANDILKDLYETKEARKLLEEFRTKKLVYKFGEKEVVITPEMRVALYLHSLNEDNYRHIVGREKEDTQGNISYEGGGVVIPNYHKQKKSTSDTLKIHQAEKYTGQDVIKLTPQNVETIIKDMDEYDRMIVKKYKELNFYITDKLNDTTEELYGYKKATVKNYFPIIVDKSMLELDSDVLKLDKTIENMGSLKSRVNSVQPIYLEGVMDAIERQIDQAALFSGMAIPVRDFKKVWGLKTNETTLNREAQKAMGSYIDRYQKNLQGDLGRGREKGDSFALLGASARGKMAMGALTGNLSVVMKQAASYPTAAGGLLGYQDLLAGLLYKGQRGKYLEEIIKKYTPLYADRDTAGIVGVNINDMSAFKKKNPKLYYGLTGWIEAVDKATVRRLWYASENYVKRNFKYEVGSDKFYKEVAKVWEDTVRRTQPIYDTMNRPEYLRQNSDLAKFLLMFKTQSFQNIGILVDAVGEYKARSKDYKNNQTEANKKDKDAAFKQLVKATSSQIIQMAVFTAITAIADAMLHRPKKWADEETGLITPESFFKTYFENYLGNMLGQLAFGDVIKDAVYIAAGKKYTRYDLTVAPLDAINDVITGLYNARQAVNTREYDKAWKNIIKASETASQYGLGVPVKNIENLYKGVTGNVADIAAGKNPLETTTTQQMYNRIYLAYQSGNSEIAAELSKNVDSDKIKTKMVSKLKEEDTIKEAADYRYKSELDKYQAIVDAYVSLGFNKDWVVSAINSVMNKTYDTTGSGEYNSNDLQRAIDISAVQGSKVAQQMYDEKYSTYKADGLKNDEAKKKALSSVRSAITGKYKSQYESGTTSQKVKIRDRLCSLRVAGERLYTYDSMKSWNK